MLSIEKVVSNYKKMTLRNEMSFVMVNDQKF